MGSFLSLPPADDASQLRENGVEVEAAKPRFGYFLSASVSVFVAEKISCMAKVIELHLLRRIEVSLGPHICERADGIAVAVGFGEACLEVAEHNHEKMSGCVVQGREEKILPADAVRFGVG